MQQQKNKWEMNANRVSLNPHYQIIGIITGCSDKQISKVSPRKERWCAKDYINSFHGLGFNTKRSFKLKFDRETPYPCMMRYKTSNPKDKAFWFAEAYYDGVVYFGDGKTCDLDDFIELNPNFHITSMLQVWI